MDTSQYVPLVIREQADLASLFVAETIRSFDLRSGQQTFAQRTWFGGEVDQPRFYTESQASYFKNDLYGVCQDGQVLAQLDEDSVILAYGDVYTQGARTGISQVNFSARGPKANVANRAWKLKGTFAFATASPSASGWNVAIVERVSKSKARVHLFSLDAAAQKAAVPVDSPTHLKSFDVAPGSFVRGYDFPSKTVYWSNSIDSIVAVGPKGTKRLALPKVSKTQSWNVRTVNDQLYAWTFPKSGEMHLPVLVRLQHTGRWENLGKFSLIGYSPSGSVILVKEPNGKIRRP